MPSIYTIYTSFSAISMKLHHFDYTIEPHGATVRLLWLRERERARVCVCVCVFVCSAPRLLHTSHDL